MALHEDRPSVLVAGATGLVGSQLVNRLLADRHTGTVHALLRRDTSKLPDTKRLLRHIIDFSKPGPLPLAFEGYIALGTTIRDAGSKAAFRAVDHDAVLAIARAAKDAGVTRLALVSALGANRHSRVHYNQVKGEIEQAVAALGFERLVIARPSLLTGDRRAIDQRPRMLEQAVAGLAKPFTPWLPAAWRPIEAAVVARAMVRSLRADGPAVHVLESAALQTAGS